MCRSVDTKESSAPSASESLKLQEKPKPQVDKFRDLARQLEADEDEAAFEEKVRKIAKATKVEKPTNEQG